MQILTYPVGVVVGLLPVFVELGMPPAPSTLRLDGKAVCALAAETSHCTVNLGPAPGIHLLELVRANASGRVVERATRWVNRPGADQAEVQTRTTCPSGSSTCTVLIGWAHPERLNPSRIRTTLDGKPVPLPKNRTLMVPARAVRGTLLTVELTFPDGRRATYAGAIGGRTRGDESVDLVPMLHENACLAERLGEVIRRYEGAGLRVRAVEPGEPGDWQLTFVAEPAALAAFRGWFEEKKTPLIGRKRIHVPEQISDAFGGIGSVVGLTGLVAAEVLREFDLMQGGSPEMWVERLVAAFRSVKRNRVRTADAVAAAGFHVGAAPRRRAVVLLLGDAAADSSVLPTAGVQTYLDEVRVPFEAWNLGSEERPEWRGARRIVTVEGLHDALIDLRRRIACQAVAWVEADFRSASLAALGIDPALKRLPDVSAPILPLATPSDDVARRTLERVRPKAQ